MSPETVRSAIASNPQSQETRVYLIRQAVENDMAEEIPPEWTVSLYNPDDTYDDTEDLIADQTKFIDDLGQKEIVVSAHESGAVSIAIAPNIKPIVKMDMESVDRLLSNMESASYALVYRDAQTEAPVQLVEPTTGITLNYELQDVWSGERELYRMDIPSDDGNTYVFNDMDWAVFDQWSSALGAMANSAETYGRQDVPQ
jgi:hypothetical protein